MSGKKNKITIQSGTPTREQQASTAVPRGSRSRSDAAPIRVPGRPTRSRATRYALAAAGIACVGVGAVGVVVPGLPTTIFLIAASYLFTRSCPWLEERLIRTRFFAPFLQYLDAPRSMPRRAKISVITIMWISVAISSGILSTSSPGRPWLPLLLIAAAAVGTWVIARLAPKVSPLPAQRSCETGSTSQ
jgi:uncharacterized membrane protein YbaN (DUF454 family)